MRVLRFVLALALFGLSSLAPTVHAEVSTTLQFFGPLNADQTFNENAIRIVSDSKTRDDTIARATAAASADIGTGELAAKATGQKFIAGESEIAARAVGRAVDTLTVEGPPAAAVPITFQMMVEGDLIVPDAATGSGSVFATVQAVLGIVGKSEIATLQRRAAYDSGTKISDVLTGEGDWQGEQPVAGSTNHFELLLQFDGEVVPGTPFGFESELRALVGTRGAVGSDAISDFGNTGTFTIILPPTYSFTSESGVFLAGPVPEPEIWALFACGLLWLGVVAKRRRRILRVDR
jgi:hypothetical protein